jgi:hypothetical protein
MTILPPSDPMFIPLAHVPASVRDSILDRIIQFAFEVDICIDTAFDEQYLNELNRTRMSITHVSRDFRVRVTWHYCIFAP